MDAFILHKILSRLERAEDEARVLSYIHSLEADRESLIKTVTATAQGALLHSEENKRLRKALEDMAAMPEYDQDDAHRLRNKARVALLPPQ